MTYERVRLLTSGGTWLQLWMPTKGDASECRSLDFEHEVEVRWIHVAAVEHVGEFMEQADQEDAKEAGSHVSVDELMGMYVARPVDEDGNVLRVGDFVQYEDVFGGTLTERIDRFELASSSGLDVWTLAVDSEQKAWLYPFACRRITIEDVLRDMLDSLDLDPTSHVDTGAVIAEYAKKLRLAGDAE